MKEILPRNKDLLSRARELRKNATKQENMLWYNFLNDFKYPFYRQKIIGNYIADFYCHKASLVVEIDGSQHFEKDKMEYDRVRTSYLNALGIKVIRFSNFEVDKEFYEVCSDINRTVEQRIDDVLRK